MSGGTFCLRLHENKEEKALTAKRTFALVLEHWFSVVVIDDVFFKDKVSLCTRIKDQTTPGSPFSF